VSLRYHDLKIRDAKRLAACALGCVALLVLALSFRSRAEPTVSRLLTRSTEEFFVLVLLLAFFAITCGFMAVRYLRTSPAQDAEYFNRSVRKGELPPQFDPSLLDPTSPDFQVRTLDYWRHKRVAQRKT
jgi:hypothetical protein